MANYRLLGVVIFLILGASSCAGATQLPDKYYNFWNLSINQGQELLVGINTSGPVRMLVIPANDFYNYEKGYGHSEVYNSTLSTGIYSINLTPGAYTAIVVADFGSVEISEEVLVVQKNQVRNVNLNRVYQYYLTLSNYSNVNISVVSTVPIKMNMTNTYNNITFGGQLYGPSWNITLNRGTHIINFSSDISTQVFIAINLTPKLITPIPNKNLTQAFPIGVAAYGLNNYTGTPKPYEVRTNLVEGGANITAIYAYNAFPPQNASKYGAGLQLNAIMEVISKGNTFTYWLQDVLQTRTNNQSENVENNIWNLSSETANMSNGTVQGIGDVYTTKSSAANSNADVKYYAYALPDINYSFPLYFYPVIYSRLVDGYPVVSFGYYTAKGIYYYDNITFSIPASSAYILVTPFYKAPSGVPYDAEFVFGGEHSGAITNFDQMNASLWLYYNSSGKIVTFPAVYSFGSETAEATTNLKTEGSEHGVHVSVGVINLTKSFVYLPPNQTNLETTVTTIPITTIPQTTTISNNTNDTSITINATTTVPQNPVNGGSDLGTYAATIVVVLIVAYAMLRVFGGRRVREQDVQKNAPKKTKKFKDRV